MDERDIDFIVDDEYFWKEHEPSEIERQYEAYCEEYDEKTNKLINDALHNNLTHLEKYDIDESFGGELPTYFEAESIGEIVDYVKNASGKIKAMLLFAKEDVLMCEVKELIDALEPYCTGTCVDGGKILFGSSVEKSEGDAKYRMLLLFEQPQQPQPQADSQKTDSQKADSQNDFDEKQEPSGL